MAEMVEPEQENCSEEKLTSLHAITIIKDGFLSLSHQHGHTRP